MKTLYLKITGSQNLSNTVVYIDNKPAELKRNEFQNLTCNYETENESVNVKIYKMLDVGGIWWFITQLLFFIISIFGIFDARTKNRALSLEYEADVELKDNSSLTLGLNVPKENGTAFKVETDLNLVGKTNKFFVDVNAKKKFKYLLISKILLTLAVIATVIMVVVL